MRLQDLGERQMETLIKIPVIQIGLLFIMSIMNNFKINVKTKRVLEITTLFTVFSLGVVLFLFLDKGVVYDIGGYGKIGISFYIDKMTALLSTFFIGVVSLVVFASRTLKKNSTLFPFTFLNFILLAIIGLIYTADLFNAYVFIEVLTISSAAMVMVEKNKKSVIPTINYIVINSVGSGMYLMGIGYLYYMLGYLNFFDIRKSIESGYYNLIVPVILITIGLSIKSALFPMHGWLPGAHGKASSYSSSILSAIVIKGPIILLIKIYVIAFGIDYLRGEGILEILLILGLLGIVFASLKATLKSKVKEKLAYSSVAQMGFIFLGLGIGNVYSIAISIFHILNHSICKSVMFLYSGELKEELGINKDEKYDGIFKYDKIGFAAFTMMGLSLSGIPILPGFISKLYYGKILFEAGNMLIGVLVVFSGLLTLSYILPMVIRGGFKNGHEELEPISNNRRWILYIDMAILIILSVVSKDMIDFIVANVNLWR
jgi:multicomponent Na+:H+ antiporter subunit D